MAQSFPSRPRILSSTAHKYLGKYATVIGEVISMSPHANTLTLRMPDDERMIVLLQKNSTTIEPNLLTEVAGKMVSKGQIEAMTIRQYGKDETASFNKNLYKEMIMIMDAHLNYYD